ncbi:hypothetical protein ACHAW6_008243 [Cyclotella cf. meneghiniana]
MEESHNRFMAPLLYHAKKVLFHDALSADAEAAPHFRGITAAAPVEKNTQETKAVKRNEKSRRGRMNAATCSLAAVSTDVPMNHGTKPKNRHDEKENRMPFGRFNSNRRGAFRKKMDSLASTSAVDGTQRHGGSGALKNRRDEWSNLQSVSSSTNLAWSVFNDGQVKVSGMEKAAKRVEQFNEHNSANSQQTSSNEHICYRSRQALTDNREKDTSILSSIHESKKERRNRRRGRCRHHVSSLVQHSEKVSTKPEAGKRATAVSSLMNLPSSIQKPQQRHDSAYGAAALRTHPTDERPTGQEDELIQNIQSMNIDDSIKSPTKIQSFKLQPSLPSPSFQSPIVYKQCPFAVAGACTSPPNTLHRLASVSNNIFPKAANEYTPASKAAHNYTPGSSAKPVRKRMDKKKTPDKLTGMDECGTVDGMSPMTASPLVTEISITPASLVRRRRRSVKLNDLIEKDDAAQGSVDGQDCAVSFECVEDHEEMSHNGVSPRNMLTSPLNECAAPQFDEGEIICAKANLFLDGFDTNIVEGEASSDTEATKTKVTRGSAVIALEVATPRFNKPKSAVEHSMQDENRNKAYIRGSAVMSIQKAPPLCKPVMLSQAEHSESGANFTKKKKEKQKKVGVKKSLNLTCSKTNGKSEQSKTQQSNAEEVILAGEGIRRSARESKPTDRFTVDAWNDTDREGAGRKVRFTNNEADDLSPDELTEEDELLGEDNSDPTSSLTERHKSVTTHEPCRDKHDPLPLAPKQEMDTNQTLSSSLNDGQWSSEEVSMLRNAQNNIDPTISSYWEEVSSLLGGKSASECREKWFSLVATPKGRPHNGNKKDQLRCSSSNSKPVNDESIFEEEDDLFQSTPWRGAFLDVQDDSIAAKLSQSTTFRTSLGLSPCLQSTTVKNSFLSQQVESALNERRKGYKTYIDNLRKDLNSLQKNSKKGTTQKAANGQRSVYLECGAWGKLSTDGTVHISMKEESEDEVDDYFDEEEED